MSIPPAFIKTLLSSYASDPLPHKPHVTLSFAQSIDAKIGKPFDGQFILSGQQSMLMTHWLHIFSHRNNFSKFILLIG
jgi:2,5-diamino-6-(ribosylamino)-4(3H)-pyrimidinone 5'-phosphate reductase